MIWLGIVCFVVAAAILTGALLSLWCDHDWSEWRPGTAHETYFGNRTGRTAPAEGRECSQCGKTQWRW